MPKTWYDKYSIKEIEDNEKYKFYRSILAERKPYFMIYIYPKLKSEYRKYIKKANRSALNEFNVSLDELLETPYDELTEQQRDFLYFYEKLMPVGNADCTMNKICRKFEEAFGSYISRHNEETDFDYIIMKSGSEYSSSMARQIKILYEEYNQHLKSYAVYEVQNKANSDDLKGMLDALNYDFLESCSKVCPNEQTLCDIILDLCYRKSATKQFAWEMCNHEIIHNLLKANDNQISFPVLDSNGDIGYAGNRYSLETMRIEEKN